MSFLLLCCCWRMKDETVVKKRWFWRKAENLVDHRSSDHYVRQNFPEKVAEFPSKIHSVRTVRLSENSFEHDFSDSSDPERTLSYARRLCRLDEEGIDGGFGAVSKLLFQLDYSLPFLPSFPPSLLPSFPLTSFPLIFPTWGVVCICIFVMTRLIGFEPIVESFRKPDAWMEEDNARLENNLCGLTTRDLSCFRHFQGTVMHTEDN